MQKMGLLQVFNPVHMGLQKELVSAAWKLGRIRIDRSMASTVLTNLVLWGLYISRYFL